MECTKNAEIATRDPLSTSFIYFPGALEMVQQKKCAKWIREREDLRLGLQVAFNKGHRRSLHRGRIVHRLDRTRPSIL
jgi:hypothetical protein